MGNYASINGLHMYYETHGIRGEGAPLVMLHGGLSTIEVDFGRLLPLLTGRLVIAIEQQAHGHTADIDRPLTYPNMAADTAALVRQLGIEKADFFGYSVGAGIVMELGIHDPELTRKLVMASVTYTMEGFHPGLMAGMENMKPEAMLGTPFQQSYAREAPIAEDWPRLVSKVKQLDMDFRGWTAEEVRSIKAPTLLIIGDSDIVRPEHSVEIFRLLGGGVMGDVAGLPASQLAVLPGTSHVSLVSRADWLASMITAFLDAP